MLSGAQWRHLKGKDSLIEDPQESEMHAVCTVGAECPEFLQQYSTESVPMTAMLVGKDNARDIALSSCRPAEHACEHRKPLHAV